MNVMFFLMITSSLIMIMLHSPEQAYSIMLGGAKSAITLAMSLIAIYAIWLSVLKIMEQIGFNKFIYKLFKPITSRLFKGESEKTQELITLNFSANLLGMGGVATPLGIKAMQAMQDGTNRATPNMILFMVINATSIQLLPTTIIGMRAEAGALNPSNIILPTLVSTFVTAIFAVAVCKIISSSWSSKNHKNNSATKGITVGGLLSQEKTLLSSTTKGCERLFTTLPPSYTLGAATSDKQLAPRKKSLQSLLAKKHKKL